MNGPFLFDWVFEHAARTPAAPAIATPSARLSYGDLAARVRDLAVHLAAAGIGRGDRILTALPNLPATVVVALALNAVGATAFEVSRALGPVALEGIARRGRVRGAVIWGRDLGAWAGAPLGWSLDTLAVVGTFPVEAPPGLHVLRLAEDGRLDLAGGRPFGESGGPGQVDACPAHRGATEPGTPARLPGPEPDDPALVLFTSGSTGVPRGVIQTHRNIDANTRSIVAYLGLTPADRAMLTLPLHYCYGRSVLQTHLFAGGSVFMDNRTAFPRVIMEAMAAEACTGFAGVPLTFEILRRQVDIASISFPCLRYLTQAGGPMAPDTIAWVRDAFAPARLHVMYGQTEATARLSYLPPEMADAKAGSIGLAIPGVELRVADEAGRDLPVGAVGELVARGANVTPGYLDEPEATAALFVDGWLRTGDLAFRDADGYLFLRGRTREMLKIAGHRVSPVEIEQVVARHPAIADAAVVGRPDGLAGEVAVAAIVRRPDGRADDGVLRRWCQERLPPYAVPVAFHVLGALPRNEAGKLQRDLLAGLIAAAVREDGSAG